MNQKLTIKIGDRVLIEGSRKHHEVYDFNQNTNALITVDREGNMSRFYLDQVKKVWNDNGERLLI